MGPDVLSVQVDTHTNKPGYPVLLRGKTCNVLLLSVRSEPDTKTWHPHLLPSGHIRDERTLL